MCIMEVRPGQKTSTMTQAVTHNISTIERDMDMLEELLKAREDVESLETVQRAHLMLKRAYADMLMQFGIEVANEVMDTEGHIHHNDGKRSFVVRLLHDAQLARKYETR